MMMWPNAAKVGAAVDNGTYTADYLVLKAEDDSVSMANDYWEKPATVVIDGGKATVRLSVNHSAWVTQFKVPGSGDGYVDTKVIEEKDDVRLVEFAADVTKPIVSKIHVTVPDIDYDHDYTIRLVFDMNSFKPVKAAEAAPSPSPSPSPSSSPSPSPSAQPSPSPAPAATAKPAESSAVPSAKPTEPAKPAETIKPAAAGETPKQADSAAQPSAAASASASAEATPAPESPPASPSGAASSEDAPEATEAANAETPEESDGEASASETAGELAAGAAVEEASASAVAEEDGGGSNAALIWTVSIVGLIVLAGAAWYLWRRKIRQNPSGGIGG
ncbi:NEAT domain-containing protein [Cohnella thailandensis]|uniref:NEAT domain-containing protein n=2 Tax=Cohnella thailandensis TaxID=557557 RepID=A0A841SZ80_9BACL|nr:NEAT domain-containing protein [Cohnella thailandensis]